MKKVTLNSLIDIMVLERLVLHQSLTICDEGHRFSFTVGAIPMALYVHGFFKTGLDYMVLVKMAHQCWTDKVVTFPLRLVTFPGFIKPTKYRMEASRI